MATFASRQGKGQGLVEYALILVLVAIVVIAALMLLGPIAGNVFSDVNNSLSGVVAILPTPIPPTTAPPTPIPPYNHIAASGGVCPPGTHNYHTHSNGTTWCHIH
jgi:pilus assembly protein Flp/PilA